MLALLLCAGFLVPSARASTVIVPDGSPSVQLAIDSGADTVLIREGSYPERAVVDRAVVLQGIGNAGRPVLAGLQIYNTNFWTNPPLLRVSGVQFLGPVEHSTLYYRPRGLRFEFLECSLDSGFQQLVYQDVGDLSSLTFRNCRLGVRSMGTMESLTMESDTLVGGVLWDARYVSILDCWFTGGDGTAMYLTRAPRGQIARTRVDNYPTGIHIPDVEPIVIERNTLTHCVTGIALGSGWGAKLIRNNVRDCGRGIVGMSSDEMLVRENTILRATHEAISTESGASLTIERNVIGECGGDGVFVFESRETPRVWGNTIFRNGGSGINVWRANYAIRVGNNIAFENGGWGLRVAESGEVQVSCNDWFGNARGATDGVVVGGGDLNVDPGFCGVDSLDVSLASGSALVDVAACGAIGALGIGCGVTGTLVEYFSAERVEGGVRVTWKVAGELGAAEVWVERTEMDSPGAWLRPEMERLSNGGMVVELDRSAAEDHGYRYRLVAAVASGQMLMLGDEVVVEPQGRVAFELREVWPSPSSGPVQIRFSLTRSAEIVVGVYDVRGRRVAELTRGVWPAGDHVIAWNDVTGRGRTAPGLYILQYAFPGGHDRRPIVRLR